mgnify:FL=1
MIAGGIKAVLELYTVPYSCTGKYCGADTSLYAHLAVMFNRLNVIQE